MTRSFPLLLADHVVYSYTKSKTELMMIHRMEKFTVKDLSDRSFLNASKVFLKTFLVEFLPSAIAIPGVILATIYASDIGANRKYLSIKDLFQQSFKS